jgi:molecular chaperone GrpE
MSKKKDTQKNINEEGEETLDNKAQEQSKEDEKLKELSLQLEEKSKKCEEYLGMLQRTVAEFDNYKKRTAREKEALQSDVVSDVVATFLPVIDNLERAAIASEKDNDEQSLKDGIALVMRQVSDVLKKLGVESIEALNNEFNPELHNAVMHIEDDSYSLNVVIEEFQKGYMIKEKVIRHSMVKVAN